MEKRLLYILGLSLIISTGMPLMAAESRSLTQGLRERMKSFSRAVTDFRELYRKCHRPEGCSSEEQKILRMQQGALIGGGAALLIAIVGTAYGVFKRRRSSMASGRASIDPDVPGETYVEKEMKALGTLGTGTIWATREAARREAELEEQRRISRLESERRQQEFEAQRKEAEELEIADVERTLKREENRREQEIRRRIRKQSESF